MKEAVSKVKHLSYGLAVKYIVHEIVYRLREKLVVCLIPSLSSTLVCCHSLPVFSLPLINLQFACSCTLGYTTTSKAFANIWIGFIRVIL